MRCAGQQRGIGVDSPTSTATGTERARRLRHERRSDGYLSGMDLLLIPLILVGVFLFPFAMAWLEPKQMHAPTHRRDARRTEWR